MLTAGVKNLEDLADLFVKHTHTGNDFSTRIPQDFLISHTLPGASPATSGNYGIFFTALFPVQVMGISEVHSTASTGGATTLQLERLQGTEASGAGDDLLASTIDLAGGADIVQEGDLSTAKTNRELVKGDRLGLVLTGSPTSMTGLNVTVWLRKL